MPKNGDTQDSTSFSYNTRSKTQTATSTSSSSSSSAAAAVPVNQNTTANINTEKDIIEELDKLNKQNGKNDYHVKVDAKGVVRIYTGKMKKRSQRELYNYGYLVNKYIGKQKGQKVKLKGTKGKHRDQSDFCKTVRARNKALFEDLDKKYQGQGKNIMKSVVAHVPDECMQVHKWGESHNQQASTDVSGMNGAPGWMAMTYQANSLLAQIPAKAKSEKSECITKIMVDDMDPKLLLSIDDLVDGNRPSSSCSSSNNSSSNNSSSNNASSNNASSNNASSNNASSNNSSSNNSSSNNSSSNNAPSAEALARTARLTARNNKRSACSSSSSS